LLSGAEDTVQKLAKARAKSRTLDHAGLDIHALAKKLP
jgi:hypothetical protein